MRGLRRLRLRWRSLVRPAAVDSDLRREMEFHFEEAVAEHVRQGVPPEEARARARREFGNLPLVEEECRDQRRVNWLTDLGKDLSYAARKLSRTPGFTVVALLSLGLGIGANTAVFTLVHKVLIESLPVREPERLVVLTKANLLARGDTSWPHPVFRALEKADSHLLEGLVCRTGIGRVSVATDQGAEAATAELVSGNYYEVLGVKPHIGRLLTREDDVTPGAHPVIVISHNYWQRRFGGDAGVVGKTIRVNAYPVTVLGVTPPGFDGLDQGSSVDISGPVRMQAELERSPSMLDLEDDWWLEMVGRMKPGVTMKQAEDSLQPFTQAFIAEKKKRSRLSEYQLKLLESSRLELLPGAQGLANSRRRYETSLKVLWAVVGAVLLLACVNLANLLLVRASQRRREMAVRLALGAGRGRLVRQLLTESLLLGLAGGALGCAFGAVAARVLVTMTVGTRPGNTIDGALNWPVLAFNFGIAAVAGFVFGLAPAVSGSRGGMADSLRTRTGRLPNFLGRKLLITAQVALSLLLLVSAGVFLRSLLALNGVDLGLKPDNVLVVSMNPSNSGYGQEQIRSFYREVRERVAALPGVTGVSFGLQRVMGGSQWGSGISVEGYKNAENDRGPDRNAVGPEYFRTLGIPIVAGRDFTASDNAGGPKVAIVNESFARFYFKDGNALGKRIGRQSDKPEHVIVGIAKDGKYARVREQTPRFWYIPYEQHTRVTQLTLYVRTAQSTTTMLPAVRQAIGSVDKNVALYAEGTLEAQIANSLALDRLIATLTSFFAVLAALLAAIGLYGMLSYSVTERSSEIGVRVALGARPGQIATLVTRDVVIFAGLGFALAIPAAAGLAKFVESLLFGVKPMDPVAVAGACAAMAAVALVAAWVPARRAARMDPSVTLRAE
ncbi:MAG: ABC transporter permease [Bryobacteraceae bacterium]|nr:ABC transporter permease [Bryobacteraceae bacterium]